jgi:hypothetical protein
MLPLLIHFQFPAAYFPELQKKIHPAPLCQIPYFVQGQVRFEIRFDYGIHGLLRGSNDRSRRQETHLGDQGVKLNQVAHVILLVAQGIAVKPGRLDNETVEQFVAPRFFGLEAPVSKLSCLG